MAEPASFRCPWEERGERENKILKIVLDEDPRSRLETAHKAFHAFHADPTQVALRFIVVPSVWSSCVTHEGLQSCLLLLQAGLIAAELDIRLYPFLPYQIGQLTDEERNRVYAEDPMRLWTAFALAHAVEKICGAKPTSFHDIANWLEGILLEYTREGIKAPTFTLQGPVDSLDFSGTLYPLLSVGAANAAVLHERDEAFGQPNRNTFSIVKNPFYPVEFGRYSEAVEIVFSREADFATLPKRLRRLTRVRSNTVLRRHGVSINDLKEDKQPLGVWVPKMAE